MSSIAVSLHRVQPWDPQFPRRAIAIALLAMLAPCHVAFAQFFTSLGGPEGGWVSALARSPANSTIYAGTSHQWAYNNSGGKVFRSTDGGATWVPLPVAVAGAAEINTTVRSIACTASGTVFVALRGAGVRRSTDDGATFVAVNAGLPNMKATSLALGSDETLYAAIEQAGVYQLASGGSAWAASNAGLPNLVVRAVAVVGQTHFVGTSAGLYRRTAGGSWALPSMGVGSTGVNSFANGPSGIYACCDNGLWRSADGGVNWAQMSGPFTGFITYSACEVGSALLVGSQAGFHRSVNGGPWFVATGLAAGAVPRCFLSDPRLILAGTSEVGVLSSVDSGANWQPRNSGLVAHSVLRLAVSTSGSVLAGARGGVYRSRKGVWDQPDLVGRTIFALAQAPWGEIYAGNYNIISGVPDGHAFVSSDDGQNWSQVAWSASPAMVSGFAFVPGTSEVVCSVSWNSGGVLKRSLDQSSWSVFGPSDNPPGYFIGRSAAGDLYMGTEGRGVRRLAAGAPQSNWTNLGFSASQQFAVAFNQSGHVFFGNDGNLRGIYRSTDGGNTFLPLNGYPSMYGHAIAIAGNGTIFGASRDMGVWRSTDNGDTWQDVSAGLPTTSVLSLVIGTDGHLYAGTSGSGVFRSVAPVVAQCPADLDHDGAVGGADLGILLAGWGPCGVGACAADLTGDGNVDGADLGLVLAGWGQCGG